MQKGANLIHLAFVAAAAALFACSDGSVDTEKIKNDADEILKKWDVESPAFLGDGSFDLKSLKGKWFSAAPLQVKVDKRGIVRGDCASNTCGAAGLLLEISPKFKFKARFSIHVGWLDYICGFKVGLKLMGGAGATWPHLHVNIGCQGGEGDYTHTINLLRTEWQDSKKKPAYSDFLPGIKQIFQMNDWITIIFDYDGKKATAFFKNETSGSKWSQIITRNLYLPEGIYYFGLIPQLGYNGVERLEWLEKKFTIELKALSLEGGAFLKPNDEALPAPLRSVLNGENRKEGNLYSRMTRVICDDSPYREKVKRLRKEIALLTGFKIYEQTPFLPKLVLASMKSGNKGDRIAPLCNIMVYAMLSGVKLGRIPLGYTRKIRKFKELSPFPADDFKEAKCLSADFYWIWNKLKHFRYTKIPSPLLPDRIHRALSISPKSEAYDQARFLLHLCNKYGQFINSKTLKKIKEDFVEKAKLHEPKPNEKTLFSLASLAQDLRWRGLILLSTVAGVEAAKLLDELMKKDQRTVNEKELKGVIGKIAFNVFLADAWFNFRSTYKIKTCIHKLAVFNDKIVFNLYKNSLQEDPLYGLFKEKIDEHLGEGN